MAVKALVAAGPGPALNGMLGRRLLTAAVLGWFALLILVPTLALLRGAFAAGLDAVLAGDHLARRPAGVWADPGHHAGGDPGQHGLRPGLRGGAGPAQVPRQGAGGRAGGPAVRRLAGDRGPDAGDPLRPARLARALARDGGRAGGLRLAWDGAGDGLCDAAVRGPRGRARSSASSGSTRKKLPTRWARGAGGRSGG